MNSGLLLALAWLTYSSSYALRCLDCIGVATPEDCTIVSKCGPHEVCNIEKYVTDNGLIQYNVGCMDSGTCALSSAPGRRNVMVERWFKRSPTSVCSECCRTDLCNINGCGTPPLKLPTGSKICYKCQSSVLPDQCTQIDLCDQFQSCSVTESSNLLGQRRWKHDCMDKTLCKSMAAQGGRLCSYCCDTNICNDHCSLQATTAGYNSTSTTTKPTTTTHITSSRIPNSLPIINLVSRQPAQIHYGDKVVLTCQATGQPTPSYTFKFRDGTLPSNTNVQGNTLTITNFVFNNNGNYECMATNTIGTGYFGVHLQAT